MKKPLNIFLILIVCALCAFSCLKKIAFPTAAKVDKVFEEWDKPDSPGCALAVIRDGKIIYKRGYGMADLEHEVPINSKTIFYLGSVSKQFVAMSIALLEEQKKLSFDDDIRKYVPEIPEYGYPITVRHLLHHTSGLRDYLELWTYAGRNYMDSMLEDEVLAMLSRQKYLNFTPGEQYMYSNSGYFLLALIVERLSGQSLRNFAETYIFSPLGMHSTHFHDDNTMIVKNRANGHFERDDNGWGLLTQRFALVGSGGLYSNVEDLYLWDQNYYGNRIGRNGQELIDTMLTRGRLNNGKELDYAFGLVIGEYRGLKTIHHGGALGGYRSHFLRFPDQRFSVIILVNLSDIQPGELAEKVAGIYLSKLMKPEEAKKESSGGETDSSDYGKEEQQVINLDDLYEYRGDYFSDELQVTYRIYVEDGSPCVRVGYNPGIYLEVTKKDTLSVVGIPMVFERDRKGEITGFNLDAGRVKNLRFVKK